MWFLGFRVFFCFVSNFGWADILSAIKRGSGYLALLTAFRCSLEFRKSVFRFIFVLFSDICYVWNLCTTRGEHGWSNIHYVHRCRSHDMSSFFHIPKHKTGPSLLTPYLNVELRIRYSMWCLPVVRWCCGTTCARIAMQKCVRHAAWINGYWFHVAFCHKCHWSHNMVWFVLPSCCTTVGSDPNALLPNIFCTLHGYVQST